jgi:hypothetical protein
MGVLTVVSTLSSPLMFSHAVLTREPCTQVNPVICGFDSRQHGHWTRGVGALPRGSGGHRDALWLGMCTDSGTLRCRSKPPRTSPPRRSGSYSTREGAGAPPRPKRGHRDALWLGRCTGLGISRETQDSGVSAGCGL